MSPNEIIRGVPCHDYGTTRSWYGTVAWRRKLVNDNARDSWSRNAVTLDKRMVLSLLCTFLYFHGKE